MATQRDFSGSSNTVGSVDTRIRLNPRLFAEGQLFVTHDTALDGTKTEGGGLWAALHRSAAASLPTTCITRISSPGVLTPLGFVPRTDIRQIQQFATLALASERQPPDVAWPEHVRAGDVGSRGHACRTGSSAFPTARSSARRTSSRGMRK